MGWLLVAYLLAETWFGATISFLQGGLPPSVWGTAQGLLNVVQVAGKDSFDPNEVPLGDMAVMQTVREALVDNLAAVLDGQEKILKKLAEGQRIHKEMNRR